MPGEGVTSDGGELGRVLLEGRRGEERRGEERRGRKGGGREGGRAVMEGRDGYIVNCSR